MKLRKGNMEIDVLTKGAYLYSFSVNGKDILLRGNLYRLTRGGMAILIPFANRVKGGEYEFEGVKYTLPKNKEGNAIHGLVLDKIFTIKEIGEDFVTLSYDLSHNGYPTKLHIEIKYEVNESSLMTTFLVKNIGDRKAPLTVGAHPYFIVSNDWDIYPKEVKQCIMKNNIPTGEIINSTLSHKDYDDCFLVEEDVKLVSSHSSILIKRENLPFIQIYSGVKGALAIEPMSGAPDAYHNGLGLKIINPGEEMKFSFKVEVIS
ncbi:aldose 1-epimerase [Sulfurisphaera javensis]|uniref:Aldose 1-epimerase n=1 Tax=Sulfurisphaera javensis TaxID=2049879 RepID=A0AAT9GT88_9CREN